MSGIKQLEKILQFNSNLDKDSGPCEATIEAECTKRSIIEYLYDSFGGFTATVTAMKVGLDASQNLFKNSPKYQKSVGFLNGIVPTILTVRELYLNISNYAKRYNKKAKPLIDEERFIMSYILDINEKQLEYNFNSNSIPTQILNWVIKGNSNIVECVMDQEWNVLDKVPDGDWKLYFCINVEGLEFIIKLNYFSIIDHISIDKILFKNTDSFYNIKMSMSYSFIKSLNFKENIIIIDKQPNRYMDISVQPKLSITHNVYQLNELFYNELKYSLQKRKKRGYALVGQPGVGKTTIVNKIIDELRDTPIIMVKADSTKDPSDIMDALIISQMVAPCIVILEDIDMLPMQYKDSKHLSTFIEYLDSSKFDAPVIFLATMNEPELIHESLMDRRGRFDQVIIIQPPSTKNEILEVMKNVYKRETNMELPDILNDNFFDECLKNKLRHSDFSEIINRMIINEFEFTTEKIMEVLKDLCTTQNIVTEFKNRKKTDNSTLSVNDLQQIANFTPDVKLHDLITAIKVNGIKALIQNIDIKPGKH